MSNMIKIQNIIVYVKDAVVICARSAITGKFIKRAIGQLALNTYLKAKAVQAEKAAKVAATVERIKSVANHVSVVMVAIMLLGLPFLMSSLCSPVNAQEFKAGVYVFAFLEMLFVVMGVVIIDLFKLDKA